METTNLSKIRRDKMLKTINEIKKNIVDEETLTNLSMIENELTKKKYGLIWEEHEERVDKELETQIPTFEEVKEKEIVSNPDDKFNFLLEGDNLHSLYLLEKTHTSKIDVIIIDPPYNTGNQDFKYGDKYLNSDDEFKHSKWLSFMYKRLIIAKRLLTDKGLIFIHIDDNEQAPLKLLCDDIFGEDNFVNCISIKMSEPTGLKMSHCEKKLPKLKEYILLYKNKNIELKNIQINKTKWDGEYKTFLNNISKEELKEIKEIRDNENRTMDDIRKVDELLSKMKSCSISDIYDLNNIKTEEQKLNFNFDNAWRIVQIVSMSGGAKKLSDDKRLKNNNDFFSIVTPKNKMYIIKNNYDSHVDIPRIKVLFANDYLTVNPCDFWQDIKTTGLDNEGYVDFKNGKKPLKVEKRILDLVNNPEATVLDFFAGSGTTAQAVEELNKDDGGNRHFILCTNNENNICEEITYKRLKTVNYGTPSIAPIKFNLKYYRCTYIPRINTETENLHNNLLVNIKNLIQLENGIEIDDKKIRIYLDEDELDKFSINQNKLCECEKIYISSDILLTTEQEKIFEDNNIEVYIIPEYYFEDEIMEVM